MDTEKSGKQSRGPTSKVSTQLRTETGGARNALGDNRVNQNP